MQVMYHFCSKNTIPSRHKHNQSFPVKLHKNADKKSNTFRAFIEANWSMISSKEAFAVSSLPIVIKAISHNLRGESKPEQPGTTFR